MAHDIVRRSFLGSIGATLAGLFGAKAARAGEDDRGLAILPNPYSEPETAATELPEFTDPLVQFMWDILDFADKRKAELGLDCRPALQKSWIDEEPDHDPATGQYWHRQRPGPTIRLNLVAVDPRREHELPIAYFNDKPWDLQDKAPWDVLLNPWPALPMLDPDGRERRFYALLAKAKAKQGHG